MLLTLFPSLRTNDGLLKTTEARVIERSYTATEMDAEQRAKKIEEWNENPSGVSPEALAVGQSYNRTYTQPSRSIFWTKGIALNDDGEVLGATLMSGPAGVRCCLVRFQKYL